MNYGKENSEIYEIGTIKEKYSSERDNKAEENYQSNRYSDQNENIKENNYSNSKSNDPNDRIRRKKKKKMEIYYFSSKYTIFLVTLWLVFFATFIVGFILHFDVKTSINASSIIWAFSAIIFVISILYTLVYCKAKKATNVEELQKYLRLMPI